MRASIVIPTYNRASCLVALLESIYQSEGMSSEIELIVVDDGSTDDTVSRLAVEFPTVQLRCTGHQTGPSRARNLGAAKARGALLMFLDADGVVEKGWLSAMTRAASDDTVLLGNVVDFHGGRVQGVPRRRTFLGKSLRCHPSRANTGPACNMALPQRCFEVLGGFDEELPYYFEDSDLCIRAAREGFAFKFVPEAVFRHRGHEKKTGRAIYLQERNSTYAMLKYYEGEAGLMMVFSVLNLLWMLSRAARWLLGGQIGDTLSLVKGWASAHGYYIRTRL